MILTFDYFSFKSSTKINLLPFGIDGKHGYVDKDFALTLVTKSNRFVRTMVLLHRYNEDDIFMQNNFTFNNDDNNIDNDTDTDIDIDPTTFPGKCDNEFVQ